MYFKAMTRILNIVKWENKRIPNVQFKKLKMNLYKNVFLLGN